MCNFLSQRVLLVALDIVNIIIVIISDRRVLRLIANKLKNSCSKVKTYHQITLEFLKLMLIMLFKVFQEFLGQKYS